MIVDECTGVRLFMCMCLCLCTISDICCGRIVIGKRHASYFLFFIDKGETCVH